MASFVYLITVYSLPQSLKMASTYVANKFLPNYQKLVLNLIYKPAKDIRFVVTSECQICTNISSLSIDILCLT